MKCMLLWIATLSIIQEPSLLSIFVFFFQSRRQSIEQRQGYFISIFLIQTLFNVLDVMIFSISDCFYSIFCLCCHVYSLQWFRNLKNARCSNAGMIFMRFDHLFSLSQQFIFLYTLIPINHSKQRHLYNQFQLSYSYIFKLQLFRTKFHHQKEGFKSKITTQISCVIILILGVKIIEYLNNFQQIWSDLVIICQIGALLIILVPLEMEKKNEEITVNYFSNAYKNKQQNAQAHPILQILGYQISPNQPTSQIIVRLSDEVTFVDCTLIGNFTLQNHKIIQCSTLKGIVEYRNYYLVKLIDFTIKIEPKRICRFKLTIRDMEVISQTQFRFGAPSQLIQYIENFSDTNQSLSNDISRNQTSFEKGKQKKIEFEAKPDQKLIKIQDEQKQFKDASSNEKQNHSKNSSIKSIISQNQQPLTNRQILAGKDGYFIGRLLRTKMTSKQTKQGSMSVLILGFLDYTGQLVRINMAGRTAIKQYKQLRKKKCYYLKGLQMYQTEKMIHSQIRIKQKQFKISEVHIPKVLQAFGSSYYHWDHQLSSIQSERVDVIGIVDDIEDKVAYNNTGSSQTRQVVRIVVRNVFKTVKISFWAEQINVFKTLKLRKRQPIILEDIRKKKNLFLDFTYESSIIRLDDEQQLKNQFAHLIPEPQLSKVPTNIGEMHSYFHEQQKGSKIISLNVYLTKIQTNRIIYKLCAQCKKKVQSIHDECLSCKCSNFQYKFNSQLQFSDAYGSFNSIAFEGPANKILGKSAKQISELSEQQLSEMIKQLAYKQYELSIQSKNLRFIIRNARTLQDNQYGKIGEINLRQIRQIMIKKPQ